MTLSCRPRPAAARHLAIAVPLSYLLVALAGCSGHGGASSPDEPGPAAVCTPERSTVRRTIVSEPGEHNVSLAGGTMTSSSYRDVPWIGRGAPVHVEVEATWDDDLPPGRMQLRIEDTEGETVHAVAAGPRPVQVAFTAEPQASAMRIFLDVAPDGDGASVVLAERVTEVSVAQTTACP